MENTKSPETFVMTLYDNSISDIPTSRLPLNTVSSAKSSSTTPLYSVTLYEVSNLVLFVTFTTIVSFMYEKVLSLDTINGSFTVTTTDKLGCGVSPDIVNVK